MVPDKNSSTCCATLPPSARSWHRRLVGPTCGRPRPTIQISEAARKAPRPSKTHSRASGTFPRTSGTPSLPAGTQCLPAGTRSLPSRTQPLPSGTQPLPSGTRSLPAGTQSRRARIQSLPIAFHPKKPVPPCLKPFSDSQLQQNTGPQPALNSSFLTLNS